MRLESDGLIFDRDARILRRMISGCTFKGKPEALPWFVGPAGKNVFSLQLASLLLVLCKNGDREAPVVR